MSIPADVLRELGCEHRTFRTVKGALLFYRDELLRRLRVNRDPSTAGLGGGARDDATFAAIANCLRETHPADVDPDGLKIRASGRWKSQPTWPTGEAVLWLVAWYENTSDDGTGMAIEAGLERSQRRNSDSGWLALKAGLERRAFNRRCGKVAWRLHLRLVSAGVVLDSDGR